MLAGLRRITLISRGLASLRRAPLILRSLAGLRRTPLILRSLAARAHGVRYRITYIAMPLGERAPRMIRNLASPPARFRRRPSALATLHAVSRALHGAAYLSICIAEYLAYSLARRREVDLPIRRALLIPR